MRLQPQGRPGSPRPSPTSPWGSPAPCSPPGDGTRLPAPRGAWPLRSPPPQAVPSPGGLRGAPHGPRLGPRDLPQLLALRYPARTLFGPRCPTWISPHSHMLHMDLRCPQSPPSLEPVSPGHPAGPHACPGYPPTPPMPPTLSHQHHPDPASPTPSHPPLFPAGGPQPKHPNRSHGTPSCTKNFSQASRSGSRTAPSRHPRVPADRGMWV